MKKTTNTIRSKAFRLSGLLLLVGIMLSVTSADVLAQVPPANTPIGNQASATYLDNGGNQQSVTSNTVITRVQQVAGVTITQGIGLTVSPGGQVSFPHTITNQGNGADSFTLAVTSGSGFTFDNIVIYADEDQNGVPDNFNPITTTGNIGRFGDTQNGFTYGVVIVADVPATANDGDVQTLNITATSVFDTGENADATNTVTVDENAVINVQKNRDKQFVEVGETVTYSFNYAESGGNSAATNLEIRDPLPAGVTYVPGSGVWSGASGTALTDGTGETASGITYRFVDDVVDSVVIVINQVNAGASGTVSFQVTVNNNTFGQTIINTGTFTHDDNPTPVTTNNASITVDENFDITAVPGPVEADTIFAGEVNQGAIVNFVNKFVNTGTATDTYNISLLNSDYPAGTTFTLFQADANNNPTSPFNDTNNDNFPDTGPVAVGDTVVVILQVNLPSGVSGGPYDVEKRLTSVNDPNEFDSLIDKLEGIRTPTVDITNDAAGTLGDGQGPETNPVSTITTNPGTTVTFPLYIFNESLQADNYQLNFSTDTLNGNLLNPGTLPSGWTASFRDPATNAQVSSTGNIAAGASKLINFRVNVPAGFSPGDVDLYVRALSQTSGALDVKHERISVNTVRNISLVTNQTGQVSPGGSVSYIHTLSVNSNVDENTPSTSDLQIELANSVTNGWSAIVYWDTDENGVINASDSLLTSAASAGSVDLPSTVGALGFGDQLQFIVNVVASTALNDGATVTTTITVSDAATSPIASVSNDDLTEVQAGLLVMNKFQAPDVNGAPGSFVQNEIQAAPGDTVWYEVVIVNNGSQPVTTVQVSDNTPTFTTLVVAPTVTPDNGATIAGLSVTGPSVGATGTVVATATSLQPTQQFRLRFAVLVDN